MRLEVHYNSPWTTDEVQKDVVYTINELSEFIVELQSNECEIIKIIGAQ